MAIPTAIYLVVMVTLVYCSSRALSGTRFADDVAGGFGGIAGGLTAVVLVGVAARRTRRRAREMLPRGFTEAQRDQVLAGARSGPLPDDPAVRLEARRLAERWAAGRGSGQRIAGAAVAVLAVVCALAGRVASPWWWGDAVLLAGVAGLIVWRDHRRGRHLRDLRSSTVLPEPPSQGLYRLVDGEPVPDLSGSSRGLLELRIRKHFGGATNVSSTMVRLSGLLVPAEWGTNRYLVPAGPLAVTVWIDYLFDYGRASTTTTVAPGEETVLHYSQPALTLLEGRIGPEPQRSAGARVMAIMGLVLVAGVVSLIVIFS